MPGLGARLGRGGATTTMQSLADSDCVVIMGSNMAENHPVGFRFVMKAKMLGATIAHVDPRFSRTSAMVDLYAPLRAGSDIVVLGGLINYVINSDRWKSDPFFREYVTHYTNATTIISHEFKDTEDLAGIFSGYDAGKRQYEFNTWQYAGEPLGNPAPGGPDAQQDAGQTAEPRPQHIGRLAERPILDPTLDDPNCVFQIVKRHFARYTPSMVERLSGMPEATFLRLAETILANSGRDRTTAFCYAVAWTQHTTGSQTISCCALLQLLLGNIGRPGGGILALRGHSTIQGSTDIPTLYNLLPGYMPMPGATAEHETLASYIETETPPTGWWNNMPKYIVSLLKAWYGDAATSENDYAYDLLPKISGDYSLQAMIPLMRDGVIRGLFCMGQNPAVGGQNSILAREALATLEWLVVRDAYEIETVAFWHDGPEARSGQRGPRDIGTEIFLLPPAITPEKEGSYTNTQRLIQWHDKAVEPPADCRSELWFMDRLAKRLKELYADDDSPKGRQIRSLTWDYRTSGAHSEPDADAIVEEINGFRVSDGELVGSYLNLRDDGSTACGCWIYSGVMPRRGHNRAKARSGDERASLEWGYAWPNNVRLLYNRASADPSGRPWSERKAWIWWDAALGEWTGHDIPDFPRSKHPDYQPPDGARGTDAHPGSAPFTLIADGLGRLFASAGLRDGPLPTHYEPHETLVANLLHPEQPRSPVAPTFDRPDNPYHELGDRRFPYVITTYRLTEHHTAGGMSRFVPWLAELQPRGFVEISPELAREHGVDNGDWVTLSTLRGEIEARAMVTERLRPLTIDGAIVHQIGIPWHFGFGGYATGDIANDLSALIEDPNSRIHEAKAFTCGLRAGRIAARQERD